MFQGTVFQGTLKAPFIREGIGLHAGEPVRVRVAPADPDTGLVVHLLGPTGAEPIPVHVDHVVDTTLATTLGRGPHRVGTVEHLVAALSATGIDNARIEVEGPEIPALDGSARPWLHAIEQVGRREQPVARRVLVVRRPVAVGSGDRWARLVPAPVLQVAVTVAFDHPMLRHRQVEFTVEDGTFGRELAWARTFGFLREVRAMQEGGYARGGSLGNALVFDDEGPLNPGGLRGEDEVARHKVLDALGDLALAGHPVRGRLEACKPGHALHVELVRALLARPHTWSLEPARIAETEGPGAG